MPIIKSAKKNLRKSATRRVANLRKKKELLQVVKQYKKLVSAGNTEEAKKYIPTLYKTLDKAAKTNLIKNNKSSRLKSRLSHMIAKSTKTSA